MAVISRQIVRIVIQQLISRRFSIQNHSRQHQQLRLHRLSLANMFHHSLKINRRMLQIKEGMIPQQFAFPISPSLQAMLTWKSSRTNSERNLKCIWLRIKTLDYVKALHMYISTIRRMQLLLLRHLMDSVMIT